MLGGTDANHGVYDGKHSFDHWGPLWCIYSRLSYCEVLLFFWEGGAFLVFILFSWVSDGWLNPLWSFCSIPISLAMDDFLCQSGSKKGKPGGFEFL